MLSPKTRQDIEAKELEKIEKGKIIIAHKENYYPVVYSNGPCLVTLNIGGSPFRINHKEIAKGLL